MGLKFRGGIIGPKNTGANVPVVSEKPHDAENPQVGTDKEASPNVNGAGAAGSEQSSVDEQKELQFGVQVAEATLQVWTKQHLIAAYIMYVNTPLKFCALNICIVAAQHPAILLGPEGTMLDVRL